MIHTQTSLWVFWAFVPLVALALYAVIERWLERKDQGRG